MPSETSKLNPRDITAKTKIGVKKVATTTKKGVKKVAKVTKTSFKKAAGTIRGRMKLPKLSNFQGNRSKKSQRDQGQNQGQNQDQNQDQNQGQSRSQSYNLIQSLIQNQGISSKNRRESHSFATKLKITEADLVNAESSLGGTIFGKIPEGHRREFFRFKPNVWIFHEAWTEKGKYLETTITYEVTKYGVYKSPLGQEYTKIKGAELGNFRAAAKEYLKIIKQKLY